MRRHGRGWVFQPGYFHDLGSRTAIGLALIRHTRAEVMRQVFRGDVWGVRYTDGSLYSGTGSAGRRQVRKQTVG